MKNRIVQITQAGQANPCLPVEAENQHPLRQAICQALRENNARENHAACRSIPRGTSKPLTGAASQS